uniref:UNC-45/Cro1/She4 central domain-containing protein n=1 Tax=Meloidogyne incognita TaxID=6306 RepID=A0A914MDV7_MELIC
MPQKEENLSQNDDLTAENLKNSGNELFSLDKFSESVDCYSQALALKPDNKLRLTLLKNRAMARLKLEDFEGAESDCDEALKLSPNDAKALYRRALAREKLDKIGSAFTDAKEALRLLHNDRSLTELCARLVKANSERLKQTESTESKAKEMMKLAFENGGKEGEMQIKALNNLLVLCRDSADGANRVWNNGEIVTQLLSIITNVEKNSDNEALAAVRVLSELTGKSRERAIQTMELLGGPQILTRLIAARKPLVFVEAASTVIQHVFNGLAAMDRSKEIKPCAETVEKNKLPILRIILELEEMLTDPKFDIFVRECVIDLLMKNLMHMDGGLPRGWSWRFIEGRGLYKMLHLATQVPELCDYPVSAETRQHVAIFLTRLYDDMVFDQRRALYSEVVKNVFDGLLIDIDQRISKIKLVALLITLMQGPIDVGFNLLTNDKITGIMLSMADVENGDNLQQSLAVELIVLSVSKYERATALIKQGLPVLKKLYRSEDQNVRVRALVGLCKCAASAGDDCSRQPMDDESRTKLAMACRKYLVVENANKYSVDVRRFACEGLSYLSLDAEIKEQIVCDTELLKSLVELAKNAGALCVYTMAAIFMNCANAYEKPKIDEEMIKLAQFSKHHVPETHPKDADSFVEKRIRQMVKAGAVTACVLVSKTESKSALDNLARCICAFSAFEDLSGQIISEGGAKLLLQLYKECTADGKIKAAHAIARLGAHNDPNIVFAGQRMYEVVKPLVDLLHPDVEGRANYDSLLTLTNLASISDSVRKRILHERALPKIEEYWFDPAHEELRAAAAELLLNLLFCEDYYKEVIKPGTDRAKVWALYCDEGDTETDRLRLASTAGFAILTEDKEYCSRIIKEISSKSWIELFKEMAMAERPELQRRGLIGIANMVEYGGEMVASEIMASEIFRVLVAITKLEGDAAAGREEARKEAQRALDAAQKLGLITPTDRQLYERMEKIKLENKNETTALASVLEEEKVEEAENKGGEGDKENGK